MVEIWKLGLSALLGGITAYLAVVWQTRYGAKRYIHEKIHDCRARLYPLAWKITGALPRRPSSALRFDELERIAADLEAWYYEEGGIYLSGGARRAFSAALDTLHSVMNSKDEEPTLSPEQYAEVRGSCSTFRTWLTRDLLSRSRAPTGKGRYKDNA